MIDRIIELSLRNRFLVVMLWIGIAGWGLWAMLRAPIDAIPDLSDNQVIVFTDWSGRSPQEVEDQITYPLTVNLQGLPGVKVVRSSSAFGFSMIFVIFEDNVDLYFARTRVLERLNLVVASHNGTPVFVKDLATVQIGDAFRTAALVKNSSEAVGGVVVARTGENTKDVIDRVKEKIRQIEPGLPPGVHIVSFYDRSELIEATVGTLRHALIEEIILVTLAHVIFLMHFRSILIVTLPLPLAVLCSFLLMHYAHVTSNVMSLAGIAIAIGVLVDAGIVVTENAFRHLEGVDTNDRGLVFETVMKATKLVGRPTFFSMSIIILAFVPVFALTGQEGKLFHPLAFAKTFAMVSATAIALTLVPILCILLLRGKFHSED